MIRKIDEMAIARLCGKIVGRNEDPTELLREMTEKFGYDKIMSESFEIELVNGEKVQGRQSLHY